MNIQNLVNKVLLNKTAKLGGEKINVNGSDILAVPGETRITRELMGGSREEREVDYQYPTIKGLKLKKGMSVAAQGQKWKIESYQRGTAMTTLTLIEPNRIVD
jgi:hypothetical protein